MLKRVENVIFEFFETFFTSILVLLFIFVFVAFPVLVNGKSMEPNLQTGNRLLVETITPRFTDFNRGDIVVLSATEAGISGLTTDLLVKRVVGLPGDRVKIFNCKVYISKDSQTFEIDESVYLSQEVCTTGGRKIDDGRPYEIPQGSYLVLGDNREHSSDSRDIGFVSKNQIQGKVVLLFWPFDKIRLY